MMNIVLFGAPGCGKGTQAQRLKTHYGIDHVSTGEVIREHIRRGTDLGRSMESYIAQGKLAPDSIVIGMIEEYVAAHADAKGCIFDGFPRTIAQAEELDRMLADRGTKISSVIGLEVPDEMLTERMILRGQQTGRADDNERTIKQRIAVYHKQTAPLKDHYTTSGRYTKINGEGTVDDIFTTICSYLDLI